MSTFSMATWWKMRFGKNKTKAKVEDGKPENEEDSKDPNAEGNEDDPKPEDETDPNAEDGAGDPEDEDEDETDPAAPVGQGNKARAGGMTREQFIALAARCGHEFAGRAYAQGLSLAEANQAHGELLQAENADLKARLAALSAAGEKNPPSSTPRRAKTDGSQSGASAASTTDSYANHLLAQLRAKK